MNDEQRKRYFENISAHRPYELELLRWNYDPEDDSQTAFQQLECLVGQHRQLRDSRPGGGIKWIPLEQAEHLMALPQDAIVSVATASEETPRDQVMQLVGGFGLRNVAEAFGFPGAGTA